MSLTGSLAVMAFLTITHLLLASCCVMALSSSSTAAPFFKWAANTFTACSRHFSPAHRPPDVVEEGELPRGEGGFGS